MTLGNSNFPLIKDLWQGVVLGTIAQAIRVMRDTTFAHEQSWDLPNYSIQNSMGTKGTITFFKNEVVGVFFDEESPRNPFSSKQQYSILEYTKRMPPNIASLAQAEALQYILDELAGQSTPIITAAFWSMDDRLTSFEPWEQVIANGAHIIQIQLLDIEEASFKWKEEYTLTPAQTELMKSLYKRKLANQNEIIKLSEEEKQVIISKGDEGFQDAQELLTAIKIEI